MNRHLIITLICCELALLFTISLQSRMVNKAIGLKGYNKNYWILARRILGAFVLTVISTSSLNELPDLIHQIFKTNLLFISAVILAQLPACRYLVKKSPRIHNDYPQLQFERWGVLQHILNAVSWLIYMTGYELCARAAMLGLLIPIMHPALAIGFMAVLNGLAHLSKGWQESLAAVPFSILIGAFYLVTGSLIGIIIIHTLFAVGTEYYSVPYQKNNKNIIA